MVASSGRATNRSDRQRKRDYWLHGALEAAGLQVADSASTALEGAVSELLLRGFAEVGLDRGERGRLESVFRAAAERPEDTRQELCRAAIESARRCAPGDRRRVALAGGFVGLLVLSQRNHPRREWRRDDFRNLQTLEMWTDLPSPLPAAISVMKRHPGAGGFKTIEAEVWTVLRCLQDPSWKRPDPVQALMAAARSSTGDVEPMEPAQETRHVIDLDPDDLQHLVLDGVRLSYASGQRGGELTKRHRAAGLLADIATGTGQGHYSSNAIRDLRRALERASGSRLTLRRESAGYAFTRPVTLTKRALEACRRT